MPLFFLCIGLDFNTVAVTKRGGSSGNDPSVFQNSQPAAVHQERILLTEPINQIFHIAVFKAQIVNSRVNSFDLIPCRQNVDDSLQFSRSNFAFF